MIMNRIILFVAISLLLVGCSSSKKINRAPLTENNASLITRQMNDNALSFNTFKAKFSVHVKMNDSEMDLHGQVRMKNDSIIWMNLTKAGLEVYRFMITKDSVFVINRIGKQYAIDPVSSLSKIINSRIDFSILQGLFTGNDFYGYNTENFSSSVDQRLYRLSAINREKVITEEVTAEGAVSIPSHTLWLNPETFRIEKSEIRDASEGLDRTLTVKYDNFKKENEVLIPHIIDVDLSGEVGFNMHIELTKVSVDESLNFPFSVSSKYQRVSWR